MKRRTFIYTALISSTVQVPFLSSKQLIIDSWNVIYQTQEVLFPKQKDAPSASEFGATIYLKNASTHHSFNPDDLRFLNDGAIELLRIEKNFLTQTSEEKNKTLQEFSKTTFGENWLSLLLFYTIEALVSDPIYGGNKNRLGWKWLKHNAGIPRPKVRYAKL